MTGTQARTSRPALLQRRLWCLVVLALLAAQALGLMHRIVHAPHVQHSAQVQIQAQTLQPAHGASWISSLFAGHSDDSTCRLFDPLGHGAPPVAPAVVLPVVLSSFFLDHFQGEFLVRWAALFEARGPPALS
jgi:hypothetical protein